MNLKFFLAILLGIAVWSCTTKPESTPSSEITAEELAAYIKEVSDDSYLGRKPFTEGERKTVAFLETELKKLGLKPGNGDNYTQDVPLVEVKSIPSPEMQIAGTGKNLALKLNDDYVIFSEREQESIAVNNSELVFCGFGVVAPEIGWNDYAGLDMKGKTAVVLVNDPDFGTEDSTLFKGNTMTYYGRWTYKYEEAERQGAEAILIIHETTSAGYPWFVVQSSRSGGRLQLQSMDGNPGKPAIQGWVTLDAAKQIFEAAGKDLAGEIKRARTKGFVPASLGLTMSASLQNTFKKDVSKNVIAKIEGSTRADEVIIYTAHWDHLGVGTAVEGDSIYNGAADNGTGIASLLSIARVFASPSTKPERSIVFLFVTAEEQGLLGSQYYAENPVYPLKKTVANLNMDGLSTTGIKKDLIVYGYGHSELDEYAATAVKAQDRYVTPDPSPEKGYYFRSDHFNFAKVGVPAIYAENGPDHREKGLDYGKGQEEEYVANRYHKPSDEFNEAWDLRGLALDAQLLFAIGQRLASETTFPKWNESSEFKNARK